MARVMPGVSFALTSAALFGASTPVAKLLLGSIDPWLLAGLLYLGSGIGLGLMQLLRGRIGLPSTDAPLRRRDVPRLALVVLTGGVVGPVLLMVGLASTGASTAALLLNLEAIATLLIAWVVLREGVDRRLLIGAGAILAGALLLSWSGDGMALSWGALLIAGACLAWGIDNNLTRGLSSADPVEIAMLKGLVAGAVNLGLAVLQGAVLPSFAAAGGALVVGFFGYGVSLVLFVLALRHLGTARTGAYFSIAPFIGAALAVPLLGETISAPMVGAALLMGTGVYLHMTERHDHWHVHEPMEHEHLHRHDAHHRHEHKPGDPPGDPHTHWHRHERLVHKHPHYPDLHHRHEH